MAAIRGDETETALLDNAITFVASRQIGSEGELGPVFTNPPLDADPAALKRLRQMYEAGGWVLLESTLADVPADLRWLYESGAVSLEQLGAVYSSLRATSVSDLAAAIKEQTLAAVDGFDATATDAVAAALPTLRASVPRIALGRAVAISDPLLTLLGGMEGVQWASPAGSLRRGQDTVGDIELVISTTDPQPAINALVEYPDVARCLQRSERRVYLLIDRAQVAVRLPEPSNAGSELLYLTGSARHLDALRELAEQRGFSLTSRGLVTASGSLISAPNEDDIYAALGIACIPPEIRDGGDEVSAAASNGLPSLVSRREIRGDLHMHSTWSDGRDSIEMMVQSCRTLGYQYMAMTDHSPTSAASRSLSVDSVGRQADEIQELRERYSDIAILHGCEVDILPDGRLDFPDRVLEKFDIVLASLHERVGHSPDQLMNRYIAAMNHPLVTMITHPTNRLVPHRPGYELDYDRLFEVAAQTRTVMEVDGAPAHLDLDGPLARRALAAGATLAVDSDCHRADLLERQMRLGIVTARRGWVEPRHVLNTRSLDEVRAFVAAKRAAR